MKQSLKWADGSKVRHEIDLQILNLLGPKTADELAGNLKRTTEGGGKGRKKEKAAENETGKKGKETAVNGKGDALDMDEDGDIIFANSLGFWGIVFAFKAGGS